MTKQKIKVFVIDDEFYTFNALRIFISQDPRTIYVGGTQNPEHVKDLLEMDDPSAKPDVILLDMRFRDVDDNDGQVGGLKLIEEIEKLRSAHKLDAKILCLSMSLDPDIVFEALARGANGYLDKNQATEGIIDAIELVNEGRVIISENIAEKVVGLIRNGVTLFPDKSHPYLSHRMEDVAYLYYRCGMSAKEIAEKLYVEESTVRTHIKRIKDMLQINTRSEAIQRLTGRIDRK